MIILHQKLMTGHNHTSLVQEQFTNPYYLADTV